MKRFKKRFKKLARRLIGGVWRRIFLRRPQPDEELSRPNWSRVVMLQWMQQIVNELGPSQLDALEISGETFGKLGQFRSYKVVQYPDFDICTDTLPRKFDLIVANQVFEHVLQPYRAAKNVYEMLEPGGHFIIAAPFLVKIHAGPHDCTRWTETGMKYFLAECGFPLEEIRTGSWGNRSCVKANFSGFVKYKPWRHSLRNEPDFPYHVWAIARKNP